MADDFFKQVKKAARKEGIKGMSSAAQTFFRKKVKELGSGISPGTLMKDRPDRLVNKGGLAVGKLYFFFYDPKYAKTLPYYDRFPLIFVLNRANKTRAGNNGFMGINLHYLSPRNRAALLSKLIDLANNTRFDETTKLALSYEVIKGFSEALPCLKQYLTEHVRSRFLMVPADEWLPAVFLPVAEFEKASESKVWAESAQKKKKKK